MNQAEDVEVILAHDRRYKFHSGTLARNSTFFADLLIEPLAAKLSSKAKNAGIKIKWMVELTGMPTDQRPAGVLELVVSSPILHYASLPCSSHRSLKPTNPCNNMQLF